MYGNFMIRIKTVNFFYNFYNITKVLSEIVKTRRKSPTDIQWAHRKQRTSLPPLFRF